MCKSSDFDDTRITFSLMDIQLLLRHLTTFKLDFGTLLTVLMVPIVNVTLFFSESLEADNLFTRLKCDLSLDISPSDRCHVLDLSRQSSEAEVEMEGLVHIRSQERIREEPACGRSLVISMLCMFHSDERCFNSSALNLPEALPKNSCV